MHALRYQSLSEDPRVQQIRLLILHPSVDTSNPLRCSFTYISLSSDRSPPYEAISYAWGSDALTHSVSSKNDRDGFIRVTASASAALHAVRLKDGDRVLWIDGLCINQTDEKEKAQQVAIMGKIYGRAERTLVYLGEDEEQRFDYLVYAIASCRTVLPEKRFDDDDDDDDDDDLGLGYDQDGNVIKEHPIVTARDRLKFNAQTATLDHVTAIAYWAREISLGSPDIAPMVEFRQWFFSRPWFSRMWMMQEIALSRRVTFFFAGQELTWGAIMAFHNLVDFESHQFVREFYGHPLVSDRSILGTRMVRNFERDDTAGPSGMDFAGEWYYLRHRNNIIDPLDDYYEQGRKSLKLKDQLMELLIEMRHFQCKDPRDRLYALLSLFDEPVIPDSLRPDYSQHNTLAKVYGNITRYLVESGNFDVLAAAQGLPLSQPDLPSWAVDWRAPRARTELLTAKNLKPDDLKIGLPRATAVNMPLLSHSTRRAGDDCLVLRGMALGELTYVSAFPYIPSTERTSAAFDADNKSFIRTYSCWIWWNKYAHSILELGISVDDLPSPDSLGARECYEKDEIVQGEPLRVLPDFAVNGVQHYCRNRTFAVVGDVGIKYLGDRLDAPIPPVYVPGSDQLHYIPKQLSDEDWEGGWVPTRARCLVPPAAQIGDLVCGIVGSAMAIILRHHPTGRGFSFVGMTTYWKSSIADAAPNLDWSQALEGTNAPAPLQDFLIF